MFVVCFTDKLVLMYFTSGPLTMLFVRLLFVLQIVALAPISINSVSNVQMNNIAKAEDSFWEKVRKCFIVFTCMASMS